MCSVNITVPACLAGRYGRAARTRRSGFPNRECVIIVESARNVWNPKSPPVSVWFRDTTIAFVLVGFRSNAENYPSSDFLGNRSVFVRYPRPASKIVFHGTRFTPAPEDVSCTTRDATRRPSRVKDYEYEQVPNQSVVSHGIIEKEKNRRIFKRTLFATPGNVNIIYPLSLSNIIIHNTSNLHIKYVVVCARCNVTNVYLKLTMGGGPLWHLRDLCTIPRVLLPRVHGLLGISVFCFGSRRW